MKNKLLKSVGIAIALATASTSANAATKAYSTYGLRNSTCNCGGTNLLGPYESSSAPRGANWLAASFVLTTAGTLDHIDLPLGVETGYPGAIISLVADDGSGRPNDLGSRQMEMWVNSKFPTDNQPQKSTKFASKLHPALAANTKYWIVVEPIAFDSYVIWAYSSLAPVTPPPVLTSSTGGGSWSAVTSVPVNTPAAFDVWVQ